MVGVGGGVGSETQRKCEFILTSAQCPSSPQLEEEGGGDLLTNPPFPPTLASGEKRGFGQKKLFPLLLPFLRPKRCLSQAAPPPSVGRPLCLVSPFPLRFEWRKKRKGKRLRWTYRITLFLGISRNLACLELFISAHSVPESKKRPFLLLRLNCALPRSSFLSLGQEREERRDQLSAFSTREKFRILILPTSLLLPFVSGQFRVK